MWIVLVEFKALLCCELILTYNDLCDSDGTLVLCVAHVNIATAIRQRYLKSATADIKFHQLLAGFKNFALLCCN